MSEPARSHDPHEAGSRSSAATGPLRDWLAAMRAVAPEARGAEPRGPAPTVSEAPEERPTGWAPRLVVPTSQPEAQDDVAEIVAENLMLKAKLRLEAERRDELQLLVAQEIRDLRAHVDQEIESLEDLRADRDIWKARCEALMAPLFQTHPRC